MSLLNQHHQVWLAPQMVNRSHHLRYQACYAPVESRQKILLEPQVTVLPIR